MGLEGREVSDAVVLGFGYQELVKQKTEVNAVLFERLKDQRVNNMRI